MSATVCNSVPSVSVYVNTKRLFVTINQRNDVDHKVQNMDHLSVTCSSQGRILVAGLKLSAGSVRIPLCVFPQDRKSAAAGATALEGSCLCTVLPC